MRVTIVNLFYPPDLAPSAHLASSLAEHRAALGDDVTVVSGRGTYLGGSEREAHRPTGAPRRPAVIRLWTPALGKAKPRGDWATTSPSSPAPSHVFSSCGGRTW